MIVGRLNKRITLVQSVKIPDGAGGYKSTWVTQATVWAELRKPEVKTEVAGGAIASVLLREVSIRYRTDVVKGWRVKYGAKTFSVEHTYDYPKESTILVCKEVVL